jgi:cardiolipin synthase (CMP-forming)
MILADKSRRARWRRILGWAHWPSFVWLRLPPPERQDPVVTRSILHSGYIFSLLVLLTDTAASRALGLPGWPIFLLGHLLWVSILTSFLLLQPQFLEHLDGRPLHRLGWANWLTWLRLSFLPLVIYFLATRHWRSALAGYVILGLTDVADGAVARRRHEESKLGFLLDPFVDILFHLGILLSLVLTGILSWWTGGLVLGRYGLLLLGSLALYLLKGEVWIQPTPFGKATGLGIATLTSVLLLLLGLGKARHEWLSWINIALLAAFAACLVHVVLIGWNNIRRPAQGGIAVYRKGWGLMIGHGPLAPPRGEGSPRHQGTRRNRQG